ncbi:MAG: hypothetical protein AAF567_23770 [Actinomycetota bacterium]
MVEVLFVVGVIVLALLWNDRDQRKKADKWRKILEEHPDLESGLATPVEVDDFDMFDGFHRSSGRWLRRVGTEHLVFLMTVTQRDTVGNDDHTSAIYYGALLRVPEPLPPISIAPRRFSDRLRFGDNDIEIESTVVRAEDFNETFRVTSEVNPSVVRSVFDDRVVAALLDAEAEFDKLHVDLRHEWILCAHRAGPLSLGDAEELVPYLNRITTLVAAFATARDS